MGDAVKGRAGEARPYQVSNDGRTLHVNHPGCRMDLSLVITLEQVDQLLDLPDPMPWRDQMRAVMPLMPDATRELVEGIPDGILQVEVVRAWIQAVNDRLGKALSSGQPGETTGTS